MAACAACDVLFERGDIITSCHICNELFHSKRECTGVSASEIKVLELKRVKPMLLYRCKGCSENCNASPSMMEMLSDIQNDLKLLQKHDALISNHSREIDKLKNKVQHLEEVFSAGSTGSSDLPVGSNTNSVQEAIVEIQERNRRNINVLLHNVSEKDDENDIKLVTEALVDIKLNTIINTHSIKRLGKKSVNSCRPILFRLDSRLDANNILKNWKSVKNGIKVSSDLTLLQRSLYKKAKVETDLWNRTNLNDKKKVIFSNGNPKSVFI